MTSLVFVAYAVDDFDPRRAVTDLQYRFYTIPSLVDLVCAVTRRLDQQTIPRSAFRALPDRPKTESPCKGCKRSRHPHDCGQLVPSEPLVGKTKKKRVLQP
jgi:hypothetical protein